MLVSECIRQNHRCLAASDRPPCESAVDRTCRRRQAMSKSIISSPRIAPRPGAPYSAGTKAGNLVFTGTMGPFDKQAELVGRGDIRAQTRQVLENVKAVIESGGGTLDDVMKTTVYITDIA